MKRSDFRLIGVAPMVVGSFSSLEDMHFHDPTSLANCCDLAEIRLDLIASGPSVDSSHWKKLSGFPLLFTARRGSEGGVGDMPTSMRIRLLETAIVDATCIDIELASIHEMGSILEDARIRDIPWIASCHDFEKLPETAVMQAAVQRAADAGAAVFKLAARLHSPADVARLADFQLADHAIPVATMGMGTLAPVSRLLCSQCGSLLNYGYLGTSPTAPGQWDAAFLKQAMARLNPCGLRLD